MNYDNEQLLKLTKKEIVPLFHTLEYENEELEKKLKQADDELNQLQLCLDELNEMRIAIRYFIHTEFGKQNTWGDDQVHNELISYQVHNDLKQRTQLFLNALLNQ